MNKTLSFGFILVLISSLTFVANGQAEIEEVKGAVLQPGQSIVATNKNGSVKISYVSPTKRKYEWDGHSRVVNLTVRPEPFQGREGMYDPADVWLICFQVRLLLEEYTINFKNEKEMYQYLYQGGGIMDWVYSSDGLVVGFGRSPSRQAIDIDLFQILLNGKRPTNLRGASQTAIRLINKEIR